MIIIKLEFCEDENEENRRAEVGLADPRAVSCEAIKTLSKEMLRGG